MFLPRWKILPSRGKMSADTHDDIKVFFWKKTRPGILNSQIPSMKMREVRALVPKRKKWMFCEDFLNETKEMHSVNIIEYSIKILVGMIFPRKFSTHYDAVFCAYSNVYKIAVFCRDLNIAKIFLQTHVVRLKCTFWG